MENILGTFGEILYYEPKTMFILICSSITVFAILSLNFTTIQITSLMIALNFIYFFSYKKSTMDNIENQEILDKLEYIEKIEQDSFEYLILNPDLINLLHNLYIHYYNYNKHIFRKMIKKINSFLQFKNDFILLHENKSNQKLLENAVETYVLMDKLYNEIINTINSVKTSFEPNSRNLKYFKFLFNKIRITLKNDLIDARSIFIRYTQDGYKVNAIQNVFSHKPYDTFKINNKSFYEYM